MSSGWPTRCIGVLSSSCARTDVVGEHVRERVGLDAADLDRVDAHLRRELGRHRARHHRQRGLRGRVRGEARLHHARRARRDVDDAPSPCRDQVRHARACVSRNADVTLNRSAASNARSLVSSSGRGSQPPALFTRMSMRPNSRDRARRRGAASSSVTVTSVGTASAAPAERARPSAATASMSASVRAAHTTSAPASARADAQCRRRCPCPRR